MKNFIIAVMFFTGAAVADDLTIPNIFDAGTAAVAAEVNENFAAVESSVDGNAADINTVSQSVTALAGSPAYKFVGFSEGIVNGAAGFFGMTAACQANFGPESRMATTKEVAESTTQPALTAAGAWVNPVIVAAVYAGTVTQVWDITGKYGSDPTVNCSGWINSSAGARGITVTPSGGLNWGSCSAIFPVACAAP